LISCKKNIKDFDKVCKVDADELYATINKSKLEFYEWPEWLSKKLRRIYLEKMHKESQEIKTRKLKQSLVIKKEIVAHRYYSKFTLDYDHFYTNKH